MSGKRSFCELDLCLSNRNQRKQPVSQQLFLLIKNIQCVAANFEFIDLFACHLVDLDLIKVVVLYFFSLKGYLSQSNNREGFWVLKNKRHYYCEFNYLIVYRLGLNHMIRLYSPTHQGEISRSFICARFSESRLKDLRLLAQPKWWCLGSNIIIIINIMSSKAAQILRALNSQISHPGGAPSHPLEVANDEKTRKDETEVQNKQTPTNQSSNNAQNKLPNSNFNAKLNYEQNKEAPEWLTQLLAQQMGTVIDESTSQRIESILKQKEKNVYDSLTKGQNEYLLQLLEQAKNKEGSNLDVISGMISKRVEKVEVDLEEGSLLVNYQRNLTNRKQLQKLEKIDRARMIKIKDGQLRSKMDILQQKMEKFNNIDAWDLQEQKKLEQEIHKKLAENMDANNYSLDSQKTKIAKDYVRYMQQQRKQLQKRRKERQIRLQQQEAQRQADLKEAQSMKDMAKHQEILQKIEMRKKKREEEQRQYQAQQEIVKKVLSEFHRKLPIFKIKEKQFQERILKPEQKYRQQKLNEIRQNRRSLSLNEIKKHQSSYLNKLQHQQAKRLEQFKMMMKARSAEQKRKQYYKGSAHARIQQMTKEDVLRSYSLREASKIKANRMKQYSEVIYKKHQPTVDQQKKKQLLKCIEDDIMKKKRARKLFKQVVDQTTNQVRFESYYQEIPEKNLYKQGNKFLEEAKRRIKRKENNEEKADKTEDKIKQDPKIRLLASSNAQSEKKNRNLWQLRAKQLQQMTNADVVDAKNFEAVKKNIENLDSKAAQKQQLLKQVDLSIDEHINQKAMLDHYYLQSIKQKMKLLQ